MDNGRVQPTPPGKWNSLYVVIILSRIILIYCTVYKVAFACRQDAYAAGQATKAIRNRGQSVEISTSRSAMVRRQCFKGQIPTFYHASDFFCMFFSLVDAAVQLGCRRPRINIYPLHIMQGDASHALECDGTQRQTVASHYLWCCQVVSSWGFFSLPGQCQIVGD